MNSFSFQYSVLDTSVLHVCDGKLMNDGVCWICKRPQGIAARRTNNIDPMLMGMSTAEGTLYPNISSQTTQATDESHPDPDILEEEPPPADYNAATYTHGSNYTYVPGHGMRGTYQQQCGVLQGQSQESNGQAYANQDQPYCSSITSHSDAGSVSRGFYPDYGSVTSLSTTGNQRQGLNADFDLAMSARASVPEDAYSIRSASSSMLRPSTPCAVASHPEPTLERTASVSAALSPYRCSFSGCSRPLSSADGLRRHMKTHDPDKKAKYRERCSHPTCEEVFEHPKDRKRHESSHAGPSLPCGFPGCVNMFRRIDNLRRHIMKKHHVPRKNAKQYLPRANQELIGTASYGIVLNYQAS